MNHTILLDKINYYDFRFNQWFCSYLSNRRQTTEIGSHTSSKLNINCGVPQGSVLFRFTRFLQGQIGLPFSIYNVISESNESPFFDLQGHYWVKLVTLFRFTRLSVSLFRFSVFLQGEISLPLSIFSVFTWYLPGRCKLSCLIYMLFTECFDNIYGIFTWSCFLTFTCYRIVSTFYMFCS